MRVYANQPIVANVIGNHISFSVSPGSRGFGTNALSPWGVVILAASVGGLCIPMLTT